MKKLFLIFSLLLLTFTSCNKADFENDSFENDTFEKNLSSNVFPTKKLQNPYSVKNMKKAYQNVFGKSKDNFVKTSHYYVKFIPKNEDELSLLEADKSLELYDYPLDYEPYEKNESFHDPRIPDNQPTYLYASVKKDYKFPNIEYEILENLFIPEEVESIKSNDEMVKKLVFEALKITNNLTQEERSNQNKSWWPSKWRPAGRILVWDDIGAAGNMISYLNISNHKKIPLERAKVRARRWFTTYIGYTNENGYFSCNGRFRRPANYSIVWESGTFDIRNGTFGQAYYNGPKIKGNWNLTITSGKSLRYATIFRAACRYNYYNIGGLHRPSHPFFGKVKISYFHRAANGGQCGDSQCVLTGGILSHIRVFGKCGNSWRKTYDIYSTTIHEIGHTTHARYMGNIQFWQVTDMLQESWADAVAWYITKIEYNWLGNINFSNPSASGYQYRYTNNKQNWSINYIGSSDTRKKYTPLFIDLVDSYNQRYHSGSSYPYDMIHEYSMHNLESIVFQSYGLTSLKNKLKQYKPNGVSNSEIDNQLSLYFSL